MLSAECYLLSKEAATSLRKQANHTNATLDESIPIQLSKARSSKFFFRIWFSLAFHALK